MALDSCDCVFCKIYSDQKSGKRIEHYYDKILYENNSFFVITGKGAVTEDYLIIVSKRHINSMCYLAKREKQDLKDVINVLRETMSDAYKFSPIVFEHGSTDSQVVKGANSIFHAHMHVIPHIFKDENALKQSMDFGDIDGFEAFFAQGYDKPYIFYMNNDGKLHLKVITEKDNFPSQIMRKKVAEDSPFVAKEQWNWRENLLEENMLGTITRWQGQLRAKSGWKNTRYVYYATAMDGVGDPEIIKSEYRTVEERLAQMGKTLINSIDGKEHTIFGKKDKETAALVVKENLQNLAKADCILINMTRPDYSYIGCISEMIWAHHNGCYVVTATNTSKIQKMMPTGFTSGWNAPVLYAHSDVVVDSLDEGFAALRDLDDGSIRGRLKQAKRRDFEFEQARRLEFPVRASLGVDWHSSRMKSLPQAIRNLKIP